MRAGRAEKTCSCIPVRDYIATMSMLIYYFHSYFCCSHLLLNHGWRVVCIVWRGWAHPGAMWGKHRTQQDRESAATCVTGQDGRRRVLGQEDRRRVRGQEDALPRDSASPVSDLRCVCMATVPPSIPTGLRKVSLSSLRREVGRCVWSLRAPPECCTG